MLLILLDLATADWIGVAAIAIPTLGGIGWLIYRTGGIVTIIERMEPQVNKIPAMEVKVDDMWAKKYTTNNSPVILNEEGLKALRLSRIQDFTDEFYKEILEKVKAMEPKNSFQAQVNLINIIRDYKNDEKCKPKLEEASYTSGFSIESVLYVAAINIRDQIINDLGFRREDIDKHDPSKVASPKA